MPTRGEHAPATVRSVREVNAVAVRIRLKRMGAKKRPFYRLVVADSRAARDGRFVEVVGHYNPLTEPSQVVINEEKALYWLNQGAQPSETVRRLLRQAGVLDKWQASRGQAPAEQAGGRA